jgi:hypothetical protein
VVELGEVGWLIRGFGRLLCRGFAWGVLALARCWRW